MAFVGIAIAAGLGVWAYSDAKTLRSRGITVGSMSPAAWGWLVFLIAIVFGILYLVQRPKAIAAANTGSYPSFSLPPPPPPPAGTGQRAVRAPLDSAAIARSVDQTSPRTPYCTSCGTQIQTGTKFCANCGSQLDEVEPG
jgi:hypothetical protein